jgi:hypothetical protein
MMHPYLRVSLACFAAFTLGVALLLCGCSLTSHDTGWSERYDETWREVCDCWGCEPQDKPFVVEKTICYGEYPQRYISGAYGAVYGVFYPSQNVVQVCPDLGALKHEFSHAVLYAMTGDPGANYPGECWL